MQMGTAAEDGVGVRRGNMDHDTIEVNHEVVGYDKALSTSTSLLTARVGRSRHFSFGGAKNDSHSALVQFSCCLQYGGARGRTMRRHVV